MLAVPLLGQDSGKLQVHGFGEWAFGDTDDQNRYLVASPDDGRYQNVGFGLNLTYELLKQPMFVSREVRRDWSGDFPE